MSTYVIGDIHGCYDAFQTILKAIVFSEHDRLILLGDYIDRGPDSFKMLHWLERCPKNVTPVRGNHDEEFACYVDFMRQVDTNCALETAWDSHEDAAALYESTAYVFRKKGLQASLFFDLYGTLGKLLAEPSVTMETLTAWAAMIRRMPLFVEFSAAGKNCVAVHAGYKQGIDASEAEEFCLYARENAYTEGGVKHGVIFAGHTPTIAKGEFAYRAGHVYRLYDEAKDCLFYDLDCGCAFRGKYPDARLACIRAEDEAVFYV